MTHIKASGEPPFYVASMARPAGTDFLLERAARWRHWARLASSVEDRANAWKLTRYYERLADERRGAAVPLYERTVRDGDRKNGLP